MSCSRIIRRATSLPRAVSARRITVLATSAIPAKTAIATRCVVPSASILGRRYASASAAAAVKEVEEVERVLPVLREKDLVTLRRQRNIGVSAHIDSGEFSSSLPIWLFCLVFGMSW